MPDCRVFSPIAMPQIRATARAALGLLAVASIALLAACAAPRVDTGPPPVQPAPPAAAPPVELPLAAPVEPPAPAPAAAISQIELDGPIKVGLLLPLSGRHGALGEAMLNAAELALFDIAGERFQLVVRDTRGTPEGAAQAAREVLAENVRLILGPVFATSLDAMADDALAAGVNVVTFSNDRTVAEPGVFVMGLAPEPQIHRLVGYARARGLSRFAVLAPSSTYGQTVIAALQEAVARQGLTLARVVTYPPDAPDLSEEARTMADYDIRRKALLAQRRLLAARDDEAARIALKRLDGLETLGAPDFDAVILPEGGERLRGLAPMLAYYDVDPAEIRFMGTSLWADARLGTEPALAGGWFTAPPPALWRAFAERFAATFGRPPPRIAALAYDAAALAGVLARRAAAAGAADRAPAFAANTLTQPSGFSGIDGVFRFLPNGDIERGFAVLQLGREGFTVLDPAPVDFMAPGS